MSTNQPTHEKLPSLNDIISPTKEIEPNRKSIKETQIIEQINNNGIPVVNIELNPLIEEQPTTTNIYESPKVVKITKTIATNSQPATETHVTRKVTTTTTRGSQSNYTPNTRYINNVNTSSNNAPNIPMNSAPRGQSRIITTTTKTTTTNPTYARPSTKTTVISSNINTNASSASNRYANQNNNYKNNNNSNIKINNQGYTKYQNQNSNQPSRIQNSQSYSGNRNQPRRPEVSSNYYKPKAMSPNPGSIKRKTINRGKPIENIQITHIIYSSRPLEFHITEELDLNNLEKDPIQITESQRNNLKKSGKVEATSSCDNIDIVKPEVNLDGKLTHYQHCQGIGMTDDISDKINPKYYSSEIKNLEPLVFNSGEPIIEILEFRSAGKNYTTTKTTTIIKKTEVKPKTNYNNTRGTSSITQTKVYNNNNKNLKANNINSNNRGVGNSIKTTTTSSNYRANTGNDGSGKIVKETTTKVQMGRRSQFLNNQVKPVSTTSTEKVIMNQNSFFKK
jgi:hypothetical protein